MISATTTGEKRIIQRVRRFAASRRGRPSRAYVWKSGPIALRPVRVSDLNLRYLAWLNDRRVNRYMLKRHYDFNAMVEYYEAITQDRKKNVFLAICDRVTGTPIGTATLRDVHKGLAIFGLMIGDRQYWGRGFGQAATRAVCGYAFKRLALKKVVLGVRAANLRAVHVFEKVGFQKIGILRRNTREGRVNRMELLKAAFRLA